MQPRRFGTICPAKYLALTHSQVLSATLKHMFFKQAFNLKILHILICQIFIVHFVIIIITIIIIIIIIIIYSII